MRIPLKLVIFVRQQEIENFVYRAILTQPTEFSGNMKHNIDVNVILMRVDLMRNPIR
jgi:hypothetical protein